jgi:phenylpropionate dioxygenase-like ring-hydroxylating dioxygenase large terminal subunit
MVLFLDAEGQPAALADRCCHRTARLSKGATAEGLLICGYHGWAYNRTGHCVRIPQADTQAIPADARVPAYRCAAHQGYAWVALEDPLLPLPDIPQAQDPQFRRIDQFYEVWQCASLRFLESAFDNAHFSFVHTRTFGQGDQPTPSQYALWPTAWGFDSETIVPVNNPPHTVRITGDAHPVTTRHLRNKWFLLFTRVFHATYPSGRQHSIVHCATPIDDQTMQLCQWLYRNDTEADRATAELIAWDRAIVDEDRDILEATEYDVCIDTRHGVKCHMASDQPGLLMRQRLLEVLHTHGETEVHR